MIPLPIFLIIWLVLLLVFLVMALFSVVQMMRFGIAGSMVYISTLSFWVVSAIVIVATASFLLTVDWSQSLSFGQFFSSPSLY